MSARTPLLTSVGSAWYSTWARSGGLPAFAEVSSLVTSASPCAGWLAVTWMFGWVLFQVATICWMLGTHVQNVRSTLPPEAAPPPPEQAASRSPPAASPTVLTLSLDPIPLLRQAALGTPHILTLGILRVNTIVAALDPPPRACQDSPRCLGALTSP